MLSVASPTVVSCSTDHLTTSTYETSVIDGRALNSKTMERRRNKPLGCSFSTPAEGGGIRLLQISYSQLPFKFAAVPKPQRGVGGQARSVTFRLTDGIPDTMTGNCWVPATFSVDEMMGAIGNVDWKPVYEKVKRSRFVPLKRLKEPMSLESRELAYEMFAQKPGPLPAGVMLVTGGATRSVYPPAYCDYTFKGIKTPGEAGRATANEYSVCKCDVTGIQEDYGIIQYYYECFGRPLAGMTTWASSNPSALEAGFIPPGDLNLLEGDLGDKLRCQSGCFIGGDVEVNVSATQFDGPGSTVYFTWSAAASDGEVNSIQWSYENIDEDALPTSTSGCSTVADTHVCPVNPQSDGYMYVDISFTADRSGTGERSVFAEIETCPGEPALDTLRRQYSSPRTMPPCERFHFRPTGPGGFPSWAQIQSHGTDSLSSNYALFEGILGWGITNLKNSYPLPGAISRIYSTPKKQDAVSASQGRYVPNGRHIYGDAADIATPDSVAWLSLYGAVATYGNLESFPCREPSTASSYSHVHMDYRTSIDAIRRYTAAFGHCPLSYGQP